MKTNPMTLVLSCAFAASIFSAAAGTVYSVGPSTGSGGGMPYHRYRPPSYAIGNAPSGYDIVAVVFQLNEAPATYDGMELRVVGDGPGGILSVAGAYFVTVNGAISPTGLYCNLNPYGTNECGSTTFEFHSPNLTTNGPTAALVLEYPHNSLAGLSLQWSFHQTGGDWSGYSGGVLQPFTPVPTPSLNLVYNDGSVELMWPTNSTGFILESAASLNDPIWEPVTNPLTTKAGNFSITVGCTNSQQFFRLRAE